MLPRHLVTGVEAVLGLSNLSVLGERVGEKYKNRWV